MKTSTTFPMKGTIALCLALGAAVPANATEGYFALAYGPVQRGQAGAGVAFAQDAMSATTNPAAAAHVGRELSFGLELFMPSRGFTGDAADRIYDLVIGKQ